jgi:hypothetical protein
MIFNSNSISIENSSDSILFIHSQSGPLLTKSKGIKIAKYNGHYVERDLHFDSAGLTFANNQYSEVKSDGSALSSFEVVKPGSHSAVIFNTK